MSKKAVKWLYQQLPELVEKNVISAENAERIREYYEPITQRPQPKIFLAVFGIIGVVLVGLGIILILAHNWDQLTRLHRMAIAVGMLLAAQTLTGAVIWFKKDKKDSAVWAECAATLLMLIVGAAIALVGQTYHLVDDTGGYLLTWMLLSLPLVYLLNVTVPALMYLIGISLWTAVGYFDILGKQIIWALLGLATPYYYHLLRTARGKNQTVIFSWFFTLSLCFCFGFAFARYIDKLSLFTYTIWFTILYFVGSLWFDEEAAAWQKPFKLVGLLGTVSLTFLMTFRNLWLSLGDKLYWTTTKEYILAFALMAFAVLLGSRLLRTKGIQYSLFSLFGVAPLIAGAAYLIQSYDTGGVGATVLLNAYMLVISLTVIMTSIREGTLGTLNIGMIMLAALITARFFDIEFSFIVRGSVFVALGIGFLIANLVMVRRKAGGNDDEN
ncbi:MAG TPA: DUF2157 domain-containing protein [Methylomusa anaerophila]|uniref:DUF2157 domain-containing protein n=1 Tax=Methylomusa anaerophila TaxID=1930071 RepID=A0A348AG51_9FIRM|nr:DUF2157 domain-containing protein [Methylomusa anaerophila]BBB90049.1 hypothetical protein MAMMFC1_00697 [Methylomusa anaerophila]HML88224.1 DUF2157 domain-containing protein [Methylomusa anaerophila]